jgi:prepilin-type N-terminal cleavage/methylation domain-containing protein
MQSYKKGFTLLELLIALFLLSLLAGAFVELTGNTRNRVKEDETIATFKGLEQAFNFHYEIVRAYRRQNDWDTASDCSYSRSWILPNGCNNDENYLYIWKNDQILSKFEDAGCKVVQTTDDYYKLQCFDAWDTPLKFEFTNLDNTHSVPYDYRKPIKIVIKSAGRDKKFGTDDDLSFVYSSAILDDKYANLTYQILQKIRQSLDAYFRYRFSVEVTERTYPDGLAEEDDMKVDWYLQLCTDVPYDYCEDDKCSNISSYWGTYTCSGNVDDNSCDVEKVLTNLNLPKDFKRDAFGNPIYINLCFDGNGDGYPNGDSPESHDDKAPFLATISNKIITLVSSGE